MNSFKYYYYYNLTKKNNKFINFDIKFENYENYENYLKNYCVLKIENKYSIFIYYYLVTQFG